jgi:perosamine synthetase
VTWRRQPPVLSPVSPRSLVGGIGAALGLRPDGHEGVVATLLHRYDARDALLTDSGTSALILALRALVPPGGTVAYPGYACIDLTAAAVRAGIRVRLYDLDPRTLSPDLDSVRGVIRRGVDAIVVAHFYGYPADIDPVEKMARQHGIPVIEDAAQGAGGKMRGAPLGSCGDIAILSFGRGKGITGGSGGAVLVRTPELVEWARRTRQNIGTVPRGGREVVTLAAQWMLAHPLLYRLPASIPGLKLGEMVYRVAAEPRAMPATAAAILPAAFAMEEHEVESRRACAKDLLSHLTESPRLVPILTLPGGNPGFLRLALLDAVGDASPLVALGAVRGYPMTLDQHEQLLPLLEPRERAGNGAAMLRERLFTVPTHSRVGGADIVRLGDWLSSPTGHRTLAGYRTLAYGRTTPSSGAPPEPAQDLSCALSASILRRVSTMGDADALHNS